MPGFVQNEEDDDTFDQVATMADRMGLEAEERQQYIHDHMTRLGYDPVQSRDTYIRQQRPEEEQAAPKPWWGGGGKPRQQGAPGARPGRPNPRDNDDAF